MARSDNSSSSILLRDIDSRYSCVLTLGIIMLLSGCMAGSTPDSKSPHSPSSSSSSSSGNGVIEWNIDKEKARSGYAHWTTECVICHGLKGEGRVPNGEIDITKYSDRETLIVEIEKTMPKENVTACDRKCSEEVAEFMLGGYESGEAIGLVSTCDQPNSNGHKNSPIRLLTTKQYKSLLNEVYKPLDLNLDNVINDGLLNDRAIGGFVNNAGVTVDTNVFAQLAAPSETIGKAVSENFDKLMNCSISDTCLRQYIEKNTQLLFRRTASADEVERIMSLAEKVDSDEEKISLVTQAMLQSPHTLYHYEQNVNSRSALSGPELASRLSFFLWNSAPDAALIEAAERGELNSENGLLAQAQRLLNDDKARDALEHFYKGLVHFSMNTEIDINGKTLNADEVLDDLTRFVSYLTLESNGDFEQLMSSRKAFVTEDTAAIYGVDYSGGNDYMGAAEVELNSAERAGLLTRIPYVLHGSGTAHGLGSPTTRGEHFRQTMLCQRLPAAPGDVEFPDINNIGNKTWVEVVKEVHLDKIGTPCEVCHRTMDPIGFAFEHYSNSGSYEASYPAGQVVDASGQLHAMEGQPLDIDNQTFDNAVELSELVAASENAKACFAQHWMTMALAREVSNQDDSCAYEEVVEDFKAKNYSLRELLLAIVKNPSFRFRNPEPVQ